MALAKRLEIAVSRDANEDDDDDSSGLCEEESS